MENIHHHLEMRKPKPGDLGCLPEIAVPKLLILLSILAVFCTRPVHCLASPVDVSSLSMAVGFAMIASFLPLADLSAGSCQPADKMEPADKAKDKLARLKRWPVRGNPAYRCIETWCCHWRRSCCWAEPYAASAGRYGNFPRVDTGQLQLRLRMPRGHGSSGRRTRLKRSSADRRNGW